MNPYPDLPRCHLTGKITHPTEERGLRALHDARKFRKGKGTREQSTYLCRSCGGWHLTHYQRPRWKNKETD